MRTLHAVASLALVAALAPTTGCYLGRSKATKRGAYVANGLLVAAGAVMVATAFADDADCDNVGCGLGSAGAAYVGYLLGGGGLLGIGINLLVPTKADTPVTSRSAAPTANAVYTVTAPGLAPATVQMR
ncbi:MAG: hypothetical protein SFX73_10240 [Kofleriaceae bacterium]|nr:hypothetical protein [Kofleriaceae bacterium]